MEKTVDQLERELAAAMATITKLLKDLADRNEKIAHLEEMLKRAPLPVIQPGKSKLVAQAVSAAQHITEVQIERLKQASEQRALTLEEIKALDLLIKNKRLLEDKSTTNVSKGAYREVDDIELLKIAGEPDIQEEK